VVTGWRRRGRGDEDGDRVDGKRQKEQLGRRRVDCSIGEGGRVKG
jgi:hypothetical protein